MDVNKQLIDSILGMSLREQEAYFAQLNRDQTIYVKDLLKSKARPEPTCDLMDGRASFSDWITSHFFVPELGGPMWLAPYQIKALDEATKKDDEGFYEYSLIAWMDIKKSIKSCIAAAAALRMAFMTDWGSIKVVANNKEQAQSRSYFYIVRALGLNPEMNAMVESGEVKINNYNITFGFNNAKIKAIPLNPKGEAGGNDDLIIWTEAWAADTKAAETMFTEMVIPPNKFGRGFKWLESYAGFSGHAPILEPIYQNNVKEKYRIEGTDIYSNKRTFVLDNHEPRLPWQTQEYYDQQESELSAEEFLRVHRNMWQSAKNIFVKPVLWDTLQEKIPPLKPKEKLVLALDVGLSNDVFAIVGVNKHNGQLAVRTVRTWTPEKGSKLLFSNPNKNKPENDADYPFGYIKHLCKHYKVLVLRYDPYQAEKLAQDLETDRVVDCIAFDQFSLREKSDKYLLDLIKNAEIIHDGNEELSSHIKNADVQHKGENKLRLIKRTQSKKIDAAVALSMAAYTAKDYRL